MLRSRNWKNIFLLITYHPSSSTIWKIYLSLDLTYFQNQKEIQKEKQKTEKPGSQILTPLPIHLSISKSHAEPGPSSIGNGSQTSGGKPEPTNNKTDNSDLTDLNESTETYKHTFSFEEGINIATHNIRRLLRAEKVQEWIKFCTEAKHTNYFLIRNKTYT